MDCLYPQIAFWDEFQGKYVFGGSVHLNKTLRNRKHLFDTTGKRFVLLPCGQCIACRLNKSRDWATRCVLEAKMHDHNCFITLTYSEENCPHDGSLQKADFTNFIKRLRKNTGAKIRYYAAGDYEANHIHQQHNIEF